MMPNLYEINDRKVIQCNIRDITEHLRAERMLRESEEKHRLLFESSRDALMTLAPPSWKFTGANPAALELFGVASLAEFTALGPRDISPERQPDGRSSDEKAQEMIAIAMREGSNFFEWENQRIDGTLFAADVLVTRMDLGGQVSVQATVRDITERKLHEIQVNRMHALELAIRHINEYLLVAKDEGGLFDFICTTLKELQGVDEIWIGLGKACSNITVVAGAGIDKEYMHALPTLWDEKGNGHGPMQTAIQEKKAIIYNDAPNDKRLAWCHEIENLHIKSGACFPLASDGEVIGALAIWSEKPAAFDEETVKFLIEVAGDIAMGLRSLRMEKKLEATLVSFGKSLEGTIRAIANIVELRDPYTAGHERRVAQLAMAIGRELGLPERQVEGLRVAGFIHDLGKIAIPAEILSKPTRLTETEYSLIRTHSQAGFDILKELDFPWPIAQTVLQHHERLDGSGYPQGLKGDEILVEARILGVADVVEAMSSHRPYRAGLGIDKALDEISRNRGVFYCAKAVETCIKLFREQGYQLPA